MADALSCKQCLSYSAIAILHADVQYKASLCLESGSVLVLPLQQLVLATEYKIRRNRVNKYIEQSTFTL